MTVPANLYSRFVRALPSDRHRIFLETEDGRTMSYGDLLTGAGRIATRLRRCGIVPGDRVTVQVEKSPEALLLYVACLQIGAIYMPLNCAYTMAEMAYFLEDARPRVVVCDAADARAIGEIAARFGVETILTLDSQSARAAAGGSLTEGLEDVPVSTDIAATRADDVAAMLYTSGTTGRSKGALLTHGNLISNVEILVAEWGFGDSDVLVHALPIFHVHGLFVALGCALLSGAKVLFHRTFDADRVLDSLRGATVFMGVPTHYTRLLASPRLDVGTTAAMRLFICGSAPLLAETFATFHRRTGHAILERYGMTETGMNTSNPLHGERRLGTVGFPLPGVALRIADENGHPVPEGSVGVIEVRGPNVLKGYWNNPQKTHEAFRSDGYFITGDLAQCDPDGYIRIVGRASDMIISGGYNVYPKEIETLIDRLEGVAESAVFGVPHADFGEAVVAVVLARTGLTPPPGDRIIADLRRQLAAFKVPKKVIYADDLPRNAMGKVVKADLRKVHARLFG